MSSSSVFGGKNLIIINNNHFIFCYSSRTDTLLLHHRDNTDVCLPVSSALLHPNIHTNTHITQLPVVWGTSRLFVLSGITEHCDEAFYGSPLKTKLQRKLKTNQRNQFVNAGTKRETIENSLESDGTDLWLSEVRREQLKLLHNCFNTRTSSGIWNVSWTF